MMGRRLHSRLRSATSAFALLILASSIEVGCGENATSAGSSIATQGDAACWTLPVVNRARVYPAEGHAAQLAQGTILGSQTSPTNGFATLATIATPAEGAFTEIEIPNTTAYRYVKYYGPPGSYGAIAEIEFYAGAQKLSGAPFGVAGSRNDSGTTFDKALDGDVRTFFEGPLPEGDYVGLDLGAGHEAAAPSFDPPAGTYDSPPKITMTSATPGATLRFTTNGADPSASGQVYAAPVQLDAGATAVKAVASASCMLDSPVSQASYRVGSTEQSKSQSTMHIGNSLTDTIVGTFDVVAESGGIALDFHRFTIPGAGTEWLWEHPTAGFGEPDVEKALETTRFDQLSLQPFPNEPCMPASDADYVNRFYGLARQTNPNVLLWIYQQWPDPVSFNDCFSMGSPWETQPWTPPVANPPSWDVAVTNQLAYQEAVRRAVMDANPGRPVYVIPAGLALRALKQAIEAGHVPGWTDFRTTLFEQGGTDIHLTEPGRWFVTVVFYSCMFQMNPAGVSYASSGLTADQAAKLEQIAWNTVSSYPLSGLNR